MRPILTAAVLAVLAAVPVSAQPVAAPEACTYDACALRVEPAFFGPQIVRGATGEPVGRLGLFGSDLSDAVGPSERALEQARIYEGTRLPAVLAAIGSSLLIAGAIVTVPDPLGDEDAGLQTGALVGGIALGVLGVHLQFRSQRAASRAVWEYNRDLPR